MSGLEMLRPLLAIAAVLALVGGLAWVVRRTTFLRGNTRQAMRVESALPLGDRRSLVIVSVEGRRLLLGMGTAQVSLLAELERVSFSDKLDSSITGGSV
jgi:flagellar protein FliO/FliZ